MTRITTNGPDHYDPRPMTSWQRDHRDGPLSAMREKHKPFWRYIFAVVLFLAVVIVVGNLIEVML